MRWWARFGLVASVASLLIPVTWIQVAGMFFYWAILLACQGFWVWPVLVCLTMAPLLVSAEALYTWGDVSLSFIYLTAQCSPFYQLFRLQGDPWVGAWIYGDSPFHYALEPWYSYELLTVYAPLTFLVLALDVCGSFRLTKKTFK